MSKITLHLFCAGFLFCFYSVHAVAEDSQAIKQCAQEKVTFDGIQPLKYADITGEANAHIPLWHEHPALCASTDEAKCKGKAYLVPGNTVAVANTCGDYAHVQYRGNKHVSVGWVPLTNIGELHSSNIDNKLATTPGMDLLSSIEGYYESNKLCDIHMGSRAITPCGNNPDTCMTIKRIDKTHAELHIESFQSNGHECAVDGIAELQGDSLVYVQNNQHDGDDGRGFKINTKGETLSIKYIEDSASHTDNAFCAINASMERIVFRRASKQGLAGHHCGD